MQININISYNNTINSWPFFLTNSLYYKKVYFIKFNKILIKSIKVKIKYPHKNSINDIKLI